MKPTQFILGLAALTLSFSACKKDKDDTTGTSTPALNIPSTYNFERNGATSVSYSGQTDRLNMLREMVSYIKGGVTNATAIDATVLKNMYANINSPFTDANLNASTKQLKDKTFIGQSMMFENWMDSIAKYTVDANTMSTSIQTSNDGSKYCFTADGVEPLQIIEKGLMGAVFYYQAVSYYLDGIASDNNDTLVAGKNYTNMEHHFDEAFGYFGVDVDFPNVLPTDFWGKYCNSQDAAYNTNTTLMYNFRKGRAAITANNMTALNQAVLSIRTSWELVVAAQAHSYLSSYAATFTTDDVKARHALSEAYAFIYCLQFSPVETRRVSATQINTWLSDLGLDFNNVNLTNLNNIISQLESAYEL